jgi:type VI secretion system secreted protein Hcp
MAMPFYLECAEYPGSCEQMGREGWILCEALDHQIVIPFDPQSGRPAGLRKHSSFRITKVFDKSSPGLHRACCSGQLLRELKFRFFRIDPTGAEELYYMITLRAAFVEAIHPYIQNCLLPEYASLTHMEEVAFNYAEIEWEWLPDGVVEMDRWLVRPM